MTTLLHTLRKTDSARRAAKAARTTLGRLGVSPEHRELMAALERVVAQLETELRALRAEVRRPKEVETQGESM